MKQTLSPRELARVVGVSESSLKRWADVGRLRFTRTAGGHRRIAVPDAVRFARDAGLPIVCPAALGLPAFTDPAGATATGTAPASADKAALFTTLLKDGQAELAQALVLELYLQGTALTQILDHVMTPALHVIGELWHDDPAGIYLEHRAFDVCLRAVNHLRTLIPVRDGQETPVAVGGSPAGDLYVMPSLMAAAVMADAGVRDINLGAQVPLDTLRAAAVHYGARAVWLSCSCEQNRPEPAALRAFARALADGGTRLIVGGRACPDPGLPPAMVRARSMTELGAFAAGLFGPHRPSPGPTGPADPISRDAKLPVRNRR